MMKTHILLLLLVAALVTSCKKGTAERPAYYIKMTIDGKENLFPDNVIAGEYSGDFTAGFFYAGYQRLLSHLFFYRHSSSFWRYPHRR